MDTDKRLDSIGLGGVSAASWNLGVEALYERAIQNGEGVMAAGGALLCETGVHTGRSPKDKFIVRDSLSEADVDWGAVVGALRAIVNQARVEARPSSRIFSISHKDRTAIALGGHGAQTALWSSSAESTAR